MNRRKYCCPRLCVCVCVCLFVCRSVYLSVCLYLSLSVRPCQSVSQSVCLSMCLSACLPLPLSHTSSIYIYVTLSLPYLHQTQIKNNNNFLPKLAIIDFVSDFDLLCFDVSLGATTGGFYDVREYLNRRMDK